MSQPHKVKKEVLVKLTSKEELWEIRKAKGKQKEKLEQLLSIVSNEFGKDKPIKVINRVRHVHALATSTTPEWAEEWITLLTLDQKQKTVNAHFFKVCN